MGPALSLSETVEVGFVVTQAALRVLNQSGQAVLTLTFPEYTELQSGIVATWDPSRQTWVVTTLTLG